MFTADQQKKLKKKEWKKFLKFVEKNPVCLMDMTSSVPTA
jgi:hypothetical protein